MAEQDDGLEKFQAFLPPYLSGEDRAKLYADLLKFPKIQNFYLSDSEEELLQGDGWTGFVAIDIASKTVGTKRGLILSNSCDIDLSNPTQLSPRVLYAPLIAFSSLRDLLSKRAGKSPEQIDAHLESIRRQHVTNIFFLPSGPYGPDESVAFLDNIWTDRVAGFLSRGRTRLFRLSQPGWYVLLLKLSIHFSRMQEGVRRSA